MKTSKYNACVFVRGLSIQSIYRETEREREREREREGGKERERERESEVRVAKGLKPKPYALHQPSTLPDLIQISIIGIYSK